MTTAIAISADLQVRDIMQRSVVTVSVDADLTQAAKLMHEHAVGTLAVVDEQGRCVGMLSASDIVSRFADVAGRRCPLAGEDFGLTQRGPHGSLLLEETPQDTVRCRMSQAVQCVAGQMSIVEAAQCMCAARLHHLVVLDESARPVGIVSSLDALNAFAEPPTRSEQCCGRCKTISAQKPK
jgi:CBS-domain-containing membrane protein